MKFHWQSKAIDKRLGARWGIVGIILGIAIIIWSYLLLTTHHPKDFTAPPPIHTSTGN